MFLILNIILIILISEKYAYFTQDCEIIFLPTWNSTEAKELSLTLKVFGKLMQLNLRKSDQALSPVFKIWKNNAKGITEKLSGLKTSDHCFYFHKDGISSVAINFCQGYGLGGLVLVKNDMLEIRPLRNVYSSLFFVDNFCTKEQNNQSFGTPHLITRSLQYTADLSVNLDPHHLHKMITKRDIIDQKSKNEEENKAKYTIELAVFVDAEAYHTLSSLLDNNHIENMHDMIFTYVSKIQDIFHHPSLGVLIDIVLVRLEIEEKSSQMSSWPIDISNSSILLYTFCKNMRNFNPRNDNDPRHWDIALLITGAHKTWTKSYELDGVIERGFLRKTYSNRACEARFSCALVSLYFEVYDTKDELNSKISILAARAAHAIGRLIGLAYDSKGSYIMTRLSFNFKTFTMDSEKLYLTWSRQTRLSIQSLLEKKSCLQDHINSQNYKYDDYWSLHAFGNSTCHDYSGRHQTAKAQCESFMHDDKDANVVTLHDICKNLECETPHRNYSIFVGRPLNGTYCAFEKECCDGECIPVIKPLYIFKYCKINKWSEWKNDSCTDSCLVKSKGTRIKRRFCEYREQRTPNCPGPYYDVVLCDDSLECTDRRWTIAEFTTYKCNEFRTHGRLEKTVELMIGSGNQMFHDVKKPWIACTVFCRQKNKPDWYSPRHEMIDYNVDPYFPDGTWCHNEDGQDYYCRQHYCLPENYSFVESAKCKKNC